MIKNGRQPIISIKNLKKTYTAANGQKIEALRGVDLDIYPGEVLGLLGPNGAGKTTLASIIVTMFPQTSGELLFEGRSIFEQLNQYRKVIGFCPQTPSLLTQLTIEQNLFYSAKIYGLCDEEAQVRTSELLQRYHLEKYKDFSVRDLSGGYKQRASIARALVHRPKIVLFDEPTVGLDPHVRKDLWEEIKRLREEGIAIILTTHYLDEAELLSDRLCVLASGQIKFLDTPQELLKNSNGESLQKVLTDLFREE